jgi:hypothetical protein
MYPLLLWQGLCQFVYLKGFIEFILNEMRGVAFVLMWVKNGLCGFFTRFNALH